MSNIRKTLKINECHSQCGKIIWLDLVLHVCVFVFICGHCLFLLLTDTMWDLPSLLQSIVFNVKRFSGSFLLSQPRRVFRRIH